jgi:hypothetical protein
MGQLYQPTSIQEWYRNRCRRKAPVSDRIVTYWEWITLPFYSEQKRDIWKQNDKYLFESSPFSYKHAEFIKRVKEVLNRKNFIKMHIYGKGKSITINWKNLSNYRKAKDILDQTKSKMRLDTKTCTEYVGELDRIAKFFKKSDVKIKKGFARKLALRRLLLIEQCQKPKVLFGRTMTSKALHKSLKADLESLRSKHGSNWKELPGKKEWKKNGKVWRTGRQI